MKIIDTHAHYDDRWFDEDRYEVLDRILSDNVLAIINMSVNIPTCDFSLRLTERYENVFCAVGIHPENIAGTPENYIDILRELAKNKKAVAIGEIGLDYHYEGYDAQKQQEIFENQIKLANELSLPVVIHCRDATEDTMKILRRTTPNKFVVHCYSSSPETAKELLKLGAYISFTGVLTFKNAKKAVHSCEIIPSDRLMLETDSPYMSPVPFRGSRCDSSMTHKTAEKLAEIKGISTEEAVKMCNENAIHFFKLDIKA